jgi:hypothetical protein
VLIYNIGDPVLPTGEGNLQVRKTRKKPIRQPDAKTIP